MSSGEFEKLKWELGVAAKKLGGWPLVTQNSEKFVIGPQVLVSFDNQV